MKNYIWVSVLFISMNMVAGEKGKNPSHSELLKEIHPFNYHQKRFDSLWQQEGGRVVASYVSYNYHSDHRIRYSSSTINKETIQMRKRSKST